MRSAEIIIVGGGPAGSAAAQTPEVRGRRCSGARQGQLPPAQALRGLDHARRWSRTSGLDIGSYPFGFLSFRRHSVAHVRLEIAAAVRAAFHPPLRVRCLAAAAQRRRDRAARREGDIAATADGYVVDGAFRCRHLVGAGGTACPVRRSLFADLSPRTRELQTATLELEFPCEWQDPDCHLWFFEHGLPGYSWYVPKASGWLNVGVGANRCAHEAARRNHPRALGAALASKLDRQFGIRLPESRADTVII